MPTSMDRLVRWLTLTFFLSVVASAAEAPPFTTELSPEEFAAAGLSKLSSEERAQLDGLVQRFESGELSRARAAAAKAEAAQRASEKKAAELAASQQEHLGAQPPERAKALAEKVRLKPGTEIEYDTVETELVGAFSGWDTGTTLTFANGQRWQVISGSYVSGPDTRVKRVKIVPGILGSFFLEFEGIRSRAKVKFVGRAN